VKRKKKEVSHWKNSIDFYLRECDIVKLKAGSWVVYSFEKKRREKKLRKLIKIKVLNISI
jgi:hypothetical protein